tara:strand:+ start:916 stop:1164 length:249 start_codon:yes stop_codon:yes gene_type:complete
MNNKEIKNIIRLSMQKLINDKSIKLTDESKLISDQIIDSLGVIEIVNILESKFNIVIEQSELVVENLDSIKFMTDYISTKIR